MRRTKGSNPFIHRLGSWSASFFISNLSRLVIHNAPQPLLLSGCSRVEGTIHTTEASIPWDYKIYNFPIRFACQFISHSIFSRKFMFRKSIILGLCYGKDRIVLLTRMLATMRIIRSNARCIAQYRILQSENCEAWQLQDEIIFLLLISNTSILTSTGSEARFLKAHQCKENQDLPSR